MKFQLLIFLFELAHVSASVNLALGQTTNQSSVFQNLSSNLAVDSQYDLQPFNLSCAVTQAVSKTVFWQVKLRKLSTVTSIHLVFEKTRDIIQILQNYRVYVSQTDQVPSGELCYQETSRKPDLIKHIFCNVSGNYVTYYSDHLYDGKVALLLICEVEVYGCVVGFYGDECQFECSKNCQSGKCEPDFGICTTGCIPGFSGEQCKTECEFGWFGPGCLLQCSDSCQFLDCFSTNGTCKRCEPGRFGPYCEQVDGPQERTTEITPGDRLIETKTPLQYIIVIGLLALLLIVVSLVAVFFLQKSRKMQKAITGEKISTPLSNETSPVYSDPNGEPSNRPGASPNTPGAPPSRSGASPNTESVANGDPVINITSSAINTRVPTSRDRLQLQSDNFTRSYVNEQFIIDNRLDYEDLNGDSAHPRGSQHLYDKLKN